MLGPWHGDTDIISLRDMLNLCMYLDGVQIMWTLLPSSGMSCYSILLKIAVKDHATLIVADHHPLNVLDEWSGSFSIYSTSMTSTMITQDGLNISRRGTN